MKELFYPVCNAKNNDEYRVVLNKRKAKFYLGVLTGTATVGISLYMHFCTRIEFSDYRLGYLLGIGAGTILGSLVGLLKIRRRLANDEKLKEARLKETDERELEVANMALWGTAKLLLGVLYVLLVLGGWFADDELVGICFGLIMLFLVSNVVLRKYYESKI